MPARHAAPVLCTAMLAGAVAWGCGDDDRPPPAVFDASRPDTGSPMDATPRDAPVDSAMADTGAPTDTGPVDAFVPTDTGPSPDTGPPCPSWCPCPPPASECTVGGADCGAGLTCIDNGCGQTVCVGAGAPCLIGGDCPGTSSCVLTSKGRVCVRGGAGCADSRECPLGYACEGGSCVDRRLPCADTTDCPWGFYCHAGSGGEAAFCELVHRPCSSSSTCFTLGLCQDIDGDGDSECGGMVGGTSPCSTNAMCGAGEVCGTEPSFAAASCGAIGPCAAAADCASGHECVDLWGDGQSMCVPVGRTCTSTSCSSPRICGVPASGGPPACQSGAM